MYLLAIDLASVPRPECYNRHSHATLYSWENEFNETIPHMSRPGSISHFQSPVTYENKRDQLGFCEQVCGPKG